MTHRLVARALSLLVAIPTLAAAQERGAPPPAPAGPSAPSGPQGTPPAQPPQPGAAAPGAGDADAEQKKLEAQIAKELGAQPGAATQPPATQPSGAAPAQGAPATGGSPYARVLLLPDISAIGSAVMGYGNLDVGKISPRSGPTWVEDRPTFQLEELELGLQAVVDPYARADVFLSFTPEGVDVEEAYVTTLSLPAGLQLRAGKLFSPFGRLNQQHPHVREFVDAPLAQGRLLASENLGGPGVDLAWLAPLPWFAELHLAAQNTAPDALLAPVHADGDPSELTGVARLNQFFSFGDATTLGVGVSAARRSEGPSGTFRDLGGADVYLRIRPLDTRAYLALQGEVYARRFRDVAGAPAGTDDGWWAQAFWRHDAYWGYGVRYEEAPAAGEASAVGTERRASAVVAWLPSEFQRIRLQVSWDRLPLGQDGFEALLHLEFGIGAHGAHPF
jgi:hypothetical protein